MTWSLINDTALYDNKGNKVIINTREYGILYKRTRPVKTSLTANIAKLITIPSGVDRIIIRHIGSGLTLWIGESPSITVNGDNVYPLTEVDTLDLNVKRNFSLYGICSSNLDVYVMGLL